MKKRNAIAGGIVAGVCLLAGLGWFFLRGRGDSQEETVYVTQISTLMGEDLSGTSNRFAGVVEPQKTVEIKLESNRTVKEVKVKEGQEVKAGDVLFEYDASTSQDSLDEAKLALERLENEALSLQEQMNTYEKEKEEASEEQQLSYTIQIQTAKMNLKKNEYDQKSKKAEIEKLEKAAVNTTVTSEIDGVVKSIDSSKLSDNTAVAVDGEPVVDDTASGSSSGGAFMTILSTGDYQVKGMVNEQNIRSIVQGEPVLIRSRVDESQIWNGTMGTVDMESTQDGSGSAAYAGFDASSSEAQQTSTSYPFYVELKNSEGLMLGQHVYIEMDNGQTAAREGVWLDEYYIVNPQEEPYVWAAAEDGSLEKREIAVGEYDEQLGKYQVQEGLDKKDWIAFPTQDLKEGMEVTKSDKEVIPEEDPQEDTGTVSEEIQDETQEETVAPDPAEGETDETQDAVVDEEMGSPDSRNSSTGGGDVSDSSGGSVIMDDEMLEDIPQDVIVDPQMQDMEAPDSNVEVSP